jgi:large subunit ribosomal protein L5
MNLKETFNKELLPQLKEKLGIDNVMAVPKLTKVVINMGVGEALTDKKHLESAVNDLELIAGQKAVITKAKKSVASTQPSRSGALCRHGSVATMSSL